MNPAYVLEEIEDRVDLLELDYKGGERRFDTADHPTDLLFDTESLDLSGMPELEDARRALGMRIQDLLAETAAAAPGASAVPTSAELK